MEMGPELRFHFYRLLMFLLCQLCCNKREKTRSIAVVKCHIMVCLLTGFDYAYCSWLGEDVLDEKQNSSPNSNSQSALHFH